LITGQSHLDKEMNWRPGHVTFDNELNLSGPQFPIHKVEVTHEISIWKMEKE
jgi:hypothetical protein